MFFCLKIHQDNIFFIFKELFLTQIHQNKPKKLKKKLI